MLKYQDAVFNEYGILRSPKFKWETDIRIIERWRSGTTGMPLIDSLMRKLNTEGSISSRARSLVMSYLTLDLKQDWRYGAYYF